MSPVFTFVIAVGALAWRGAAGIVELGRGLETMRPLIMLRHPGIASFASLYLYFAVLAAIANGYVLLGFWGIIVLPVVTWLAFQGIDILISLSKNVNESSIFSPILHLIVFGLIYFITTILLMLSLITAA